MMERSSLVLRTAIRLVFPLTLVLAFYALLRGHDAPGGGFIGGLMAAIGFSVYRMAFGREAFYRLLPVHPRWLVVGGLSLALCIGTIPLLFGQPILRSGVTTLQVGRDGIHLGSPMLFDFGVFLVVVGVAIGMITRLGEELDQ